MNEEQKVEENTTQNTVQTATQPENVAQTDVQAQASVNVQNNAQVDDPNQIGSEAQMEEQPLTEEPNQKGEAVGQTYEQPEKVKIGEGPNVLDNRCPNCGAALFFNAELGKWKCNYCDSQFTLEDLQKHKNASSTQYNAQPVQSEVEYKEVSGNPNFVSYHCQDCGAEIIADEQTAATFCVYCGNVAILRNKLSGAFSPDLVIPFAKNQNTAKEAFKSLAKGRPLMPKGFNDPVNIEKIRGIYIPFWLYDMKIEGQVQFDATRERSWSSGNTRYTETNYYDVIREGSMEYEKIPEDCSTRFDNDIMNSIEPFDYSGIVPYNHAYLSGFLAEKFDEEEDKIQDIVIKRAINTSVDQMKTTMSRYDSKIVKNNNLKATSVKRNYALMPVYMVNIKYQNKPYTFAMNGQTGKMVGNIPIDKKKAWTYAIVIFIAVFALIILVSFLLYLGGK